MTFLSRDVYRRRHRRLPRKGGLLSRPRHYRRKKAKLSSYLRRDVPLFHQRREKNRCPSRRIFGRGGKGRGQRLPATRKRKKKKEVRCRQEELDGVYREKERGERRELDP